LGSNVDEPIYMLNVLWFKSDGGRERYRQYLKAAGPLAAKFGAKKLDSYVPDLTVIGEFNADLIFVVEWPSWSEFQSFINAPEFQLLRGLRETALEKSLLIRCRRQG